MKISGINDSVNEQLFFFTFGISIKDSCEKKKQKCVEKAYLDFCRTIDYKNVNRLQKNNYKNQTYKLILDLLEWYPQIDGKNYTLFDDWHCYAIEKMIDKPKEYQEMFGELQITVGQAQKWLNMSIKYMRMMGLLNKDIKSEYIHIPIDNYIIDAARREGKISELFDVEGLGIMPTFSEKWSKIADYKKYLEYQQAIRQKLQNRNCNPIEWESEAWMAEATVRTEETLKGNKER